MAGRVCKLLHSFYLPEGESHAMSASLLEGRNENAQKKDLLPTPKSGFTHPEENFQTNKQTNMISRVELSLRVFLPDYGYLTHKKQSVFVRPNGGLERKEESLLFHTWPVMRRSACSREDWVAPMKIPQGQCMAPNDSGYTITSPKVRCANGRGENGCNL
ncbi:uncharacterized protein [Physeter macrocephalus]|uniref:Uncharacterized protein isoform X2 n=1 Tax=Physeter macrocephalus TaxID=9755 RepID=A0A455BT27_PHYMC|nr:uncharacterized protein LOC114487222 isoform X2 [Physeter catodon]|eukprot:XP_028352134.1 uncharacterized protein LOC114487222 isoform X2 [Physeter catodon]